MAHVCEGSGKLTLAGKKSPETGVRVSISHEELIQDLPNGLKFRLKKTVVHCVTPQHGETLLPADYDLVMNGELLRLKKLPGNSEWLVLSSPTF